MRWLSCIAVLLFASSALADPPKHEWQPTTQQRGQAAATGIHLETVDYGYPSQTFTFERQGRQLQMSYTDVAPTGNANGETVVLLHGKNFNGDYWARTAGDLAEAGFRVVIPDQIGFGKSSKPLPFHYTFHGMALDTVQLLDHLEAETFHVVGHSMG
ncbi:MAG: alpha/beta fold hydrolase, partial [Planctomycetota bacterium]